MALIYLRMLLLLVCQIIIHLLVVIDTSIHVKPCNYLSQSPSGGKPQKGPGDRFPGGDRLELVTDTRRKLLSMLKSVRSIQYLLEVIFCDIIYN